MGKKVIKLTQADLVKHITNVISEQVANRPTPKEDSRVTDTGMYAGGQAGPGKMDYTTRREDLKLDSSLFANGVSKIDTNSSAYKRAVAAIKSFASEKLMLGTGEAVVGVAGGASAVGSKQGFNNQALATKRAVNFVQAIMKEPGMGKVKFIIGNPIVGRAEVKNSPEAMAEQFVKIYLHREAITAKQRAAIDNTENFIKFIKPSKEEAGGEKIIPTGSRVTVCVEIPKSAMSGLDAFVKSVSGKIISQK